MHSLIPAITALQQFSHVLRERDEPGLQPRVHLAELEGVGGEGGVGAEAEEPVRVVTKQVALIGVLRCEETGFQEEFRNH